MDVSAIIVDSDGFVFAGTEGSGVFRSTDQQNVLFVYPGDTNNDGVVDARDILPIGRYFGITGSSREDLSLDWRAQELTSLWAPIDASFADSDGNGKVEANDVEGIIKNWNATQTGGVALSYSSVEVSRQLLNVIGSNPQSEPMKAIRKYLLKYISENNVSTSDFSLEQNWPNPFNSSTTIRYNIPERSKKVKITIFNISGQHIWEKTATNVQPGSYEFKWAGKTTYGLIVPSGVYFYRLQADSYNETKEMVLLK